MNMITVDNKAEAHALMDACSENNHKARIIKLSDCYLVLIFV